MTKIKNFLQYWKFNNYDAVSYETIYDDTIINLDVYYDYDVINIFNCNELIEILSKISTFTALLINMMMIKRKLLKNII